MPVSFDFSCIEWKRNWNLNSCLIILYEQKCHQMNMNKRTKEKMCGNTIDIYNNLFRLVCCLFSRNCFGPFHPFGVYLFGTLFIWWLQRQQLNLFETNRFIGVIRFVLLALVSILNKHQIVGVYATLYSMTLNFEHTHAALNRFCSFSHFQAGKKSLHFNKWFGFTLLCVSRMSWIACKFYELKWKRENLWHARKLYFNASWTDSN